MKRFRVGEYMKQIKEKTEKVIAGKDKMKEMDENLKEIEECLERKKKEIELKKKEVKAKELQLERLDKKVGIFTINVFFKK